MDSDMDAGPGTRRRSSWTKLLILAVAVLCVGTWSSVRPSRPKPSWQIFVERHRALQPRPGWVRHLAADEKKYRLEERLDRPLKAAYLEQSGPSLDVEALPERRHDVIDIHEHVLDEAQASRLLAAMDALRIQRAALMGTSKYTFLLDDRTGFEDFEQNNEEILKISRNHPGRFVPFPTLFPPAEKNLERLVDYAARGAQGLKLYLGHGASTGKEPFHMMGLDDPRMKPIYRWCQDHQFPLMLHVNLTLFYAEFVRVMEEFPYLRVCVPHFGLFKNDLTRLTRLGWLLDRYPNLYTDMGFGWYQYQIEGFEKMASWPMRFREFLTRHAGKVMYGADMVVDPTKDDPFILYTCRSYMQILEMSHFRFYLRPRRPMRGLALPPEVLGKIYEETPRRFLMIGSDGSLPDRTRAGIPAAWAGKIPGLPPEVPEVAPLPPGSEYFHSPRAPPAGASRPSDIGHLAFPRLPHSSMSPSVQATSPGS